MHVLSLADSLSSLPTIPMNLSQMLSINVDDPNNNNLIGQKSNPSLITGDFNDNLLLSTLSTTSTTSVIVKHESTKQQSSNNFKIHRPVPIDQENFFASNPSVLLNSSNDDTSSNLKLDQFASHPRIAFRRISAPSNLLSSQLNNFAQMNTFINTNQLAELLLRQKLCQQLQLVDSKATFTNFKVPTSINQPIINTNCLNVTQNKTIVGTIVGKEQQIDNKVALIVEHKNFNSKRRNSEPVNNRCKNKDGKIHFLWEFLLYLLSDKKYSNYICWLDQKNGIFKLLDSRAVSNLWGLYKNKSNMQYETLARALRYYYAKNLLRKINGRLVYQFVNLSERQLDFNTTT